MKVYWSLQETGLGLEKGLKFEQIERGEGIPAPPATFVKKFFFIYCFVNCYMSFSLFLDVFLSFLVVQTSTLHFIVGYNMLYFLKKLDTPVFLLFEAIFFVVISPVYFPQYILKQISDVLKNIIIIY